MKPIYILILSLTLLCGCVKETEIIYDIDPESASREEYLEYISYLKDRYFVRDELNQPSGSFVSEVDE